MISQNFWFTQILWDAANTIRRKEPVNKILEKDKRISISHLASQKQLQTTGGSRFIFSLHARFATASYIRFLQLYLREALLVPVFTACRIVRHDGSNERRSLGQCNMTKKRMKDTFGYLLDVDIFFYVPLP
jgi:hypothetical protein